MNVQNLSDEFTKLEKALSLQVSRLSVIDPLRCWFEAEIRSLRSAAESEQDVDALNAAFRGLRQVQHLVFEHCVRLRNGDDCTSDVQAPVSYLSMRAKLPADVMETAKQKRFSIEPSLLFSDAWDNQTFDPVSPTAKIVGYLRSRDASLQIDSGLEFNQEGGRLLRELTEVDEDTEQLMGDLFQSRHHCINAAIAETGARQIVEIASGISPRGLQWAQSVPDSIYIESDLPALMIHKAKRLRNHILGTNVLNRGILHCCAVDALCENGLRDVVASIDTNAPLTIVSEGLLLYFSENELHKFLGNIFGLLSGHSGSVWITDMVTQENLRELFDGHPGVARAVKSVFSLTGREVVGKNPFQTDRCVTTMLEDANLTVARTSSLRQFSKTGRSDKHIGSVVGNRRIWTICAA